MPFLANKKLDIYILTIYILHIVYLINIKYRGSLLLNKDFFLHPQDPMQRRYEALRALIVEEQRPEKVAQHFGYSIHTLRALMRDSQKEALPPFFLPLKRGPKAPHQRPFNSKIESSTFGNATTRWMKSKRPFSAREKRSRIKPSTCF